MDTLSKFSESDLERVLEKIELSKEDLGFWSLETRYWLSLKNMSEVSGTTETKEDIARVLYYGFLSNYKREKLYLEGNYPDSFQMRRVFDRSLGVCKDLYERFDLDIPEEYSDIVWWGNPKVS